MRRVKAQFRPPWRPTRGALAVLGTLSACAVTALGGAAWQYHRVVELRAQVSHLIEAGQTSATPSPPHPASPYDASVRQFLRERGAGWAPMLRTLESGAMVGVTPTSVEFSASDGVARVELSYSDSLTLSDYLGRINEGVAPGVQLMRWTLLQTRALPSGNQSPAATAAGVTPFIATQSVATIRSAWQDSAMPEAPAP